MCGIYSTGGVKIGYYKHFADVFMWNSYGIFNYSNPHFWPVNFCCANMRKMSTSQNQGWKTSRFLEKKRFSFFV